MKRYNQVFVFLTMLFLLILPAKSQDYIADHLKAKEEVIRNIPVEYINKARTELVIAYQHTSHGTHVSRGAFGLQDYKAGDDVLFGISSTPEAGKLEFRDFALAGYAPPGVSASDLSQNETAFIQTTRNYLDAPENASVNVIMWSWCDIAMHDVEGNYLPGMDSLISEYGPGGTKIGTGAGQREVPVAFIYMTGHANKDANTGDLRPREQAVLITSQCKSTQQFCLDYYSIDTHDMDGNYYEDASDNAVSDTYGGNFYADWQDSHSLGEHYFENKKSPGGEVAFGSHNSQHITANRKAYALWWILARMSGWDSSGATSLSSSDQKDFSIYPNPGDGRFVLEAPQLDFQEVRILNSLGSVVEIIRFPEGDAARRVLDLSHIEPGFYIVKLSGSKQMLYSTSLIISY